MTDEDKSRTLLDNARAMRNHLRNIADVVRDVDPKLAELLADAHDPGDDAPEIDRLIWEGRKSLDEAKRRAEETARKVEQEWPELA